MHPVNVERSVTVPVSVAEAYRATLPMPLPELFSHWFGPLPPIKAVTGQQGEWGTVGQTRTIHLTGGGSMREELTRVDAPAGFAYRLTDISGAMGPLVDHVEGSWSFDPAGDGTRVTWAWKLHPMSRPVRPLVLAIGRLWPGYAKRALTELAGRLT